MPAMFAIADARSGANGEVALEGRHLDRDLESANGGGLG